MLRGPPAPNSRRRVTSNSCRPSVAVPGPPAPVRMGPGYRLSMSCSINDLKVLEDFASTSRKG